MSESLQKMSDVVLSGKIKYYWKNIVYLTPHTAVVDNVRDSSKRHDLRQVIDSIDWTFKSQSQEAETIEETEAVSMAMKAYNDYKIKFKENIGFDRKGKNYGK